jgi:hypothetical protein
LPRWPQGLRRTTATSWLFERGVPGRLQHGRARRRRPPIQASSISTSPRRGGTLNSYGNGHERCTFSP